MCLCGPGENNCQYARRNDILGSQKRIMKFVEYLMYNGAKDESENIMWCVSIVPSHSVFTTGTRCQH